MPANSISGKIIFFILVFLNTSFSITPHLHDGDKHKDEHLHFAHPLNSESLSPDTKIKPFYLFDNLSGIKKSHSFGFELEYSFFKEFSIELNLPYTITDNGINSTDSHLNNIDVALKFANFAFEKYGLLLGYGIEFGLPTGDQNLNIGSDHLLDIEPYLALGYKTNNLELQTFSRFGIPTKQRNNEEVETEYLFQFSSLYYLQNDFQLILEFEGNIVLSGEESGNSAWYIIPGVKFAPFNVKNIIFGSGIKLPLTDSREFETEVLFTVFYHL